MEILGSKILITGAAKRIGRAIALALAEQGAQVLLHYHRSGPEARALQKQIRKDFNYEAPLLRADLRQPAQVFRLAEAAWKAFGSLDVLINNASTFFPVAVGRITPKDWHEAVSVNAEAPLYLMDRLGPRMQERRRGKIINIGDWNYLRPASRFLSYCAAKAALLSLSQAYAKALAPQVQVNAILPGAILWPPDAMKIPKRKVLERTLVKRQGSPQDIVKTVEFLIRDGDYLTGSFITVDGGASLY
jgi:Dehydrogenases with different specificities (related to short-chain alcohol dehydrogenases)